MNFHNDEKLASKSEKKAHKTPQKFDPAPLIRVSMLQPEYGKIVFG